MGVIARSMLKAQNHNDLTAMMFVRKINGSEKG
jgi:hypothetical protein